MAKQVLPVLLLVSSCVAFETPDEKVRPQATGSCDHPARQDSTGTFVGPQTAYDPALSISEFLPPARPDCPVDIDLTLTAAETVRTTVDMKMELWCERIGAVDSEFPTQVFRFVQVAGDATKLHGYIRIETAPPCIAKDSSPFDWPFFPAKWHLIIERNDDPQTSQIFDLAGQFHYVPFDTWDDPD